MSDNQDSSSPVSKPEEKLSKEDLQRVEKYLSSPIHQVERKPFKPWIMMLMLVLTVLFLSGLSLVISWFVIE